MYLNKDETVHRTLGEKERDSFRILYTGYLVSILKIKSEIDREREREREKENDKESEKERDREREQQKI